MAPERVGKYELIALLGRGGVGEVWKARDTELGRVVALKLLRYANAETLARFKREAHAVARLNHAHIAQVYEFSLDPPCLAMQFIEGALIDEAPGDRIAALRDAARALEVAHAAGLLHRDVKPDNIMVDAAGRAYVLDFGIAREVRGDVTGMTNTGDILGTPQYMSPEQACGRRNLDARTDVYGLGATLYHIVAGRPPFTGPTAFDILKKVVEEDPLPSGADADIETIMLKAMEKEPDRRYGSAAEFADDLDRYLRKEPIRARPAGTIYRLRKRIQRQPVVWGLGALLTVSLIGGAAFGVAYLVVKNRELVARARLEENLRLEADRRRAQAEAASIVEAARSRLADVNAVFYIRGASLAPYLDLLDEVRRECGRARHLVPGFAPAWYWTGKTYMIERRFPEAIDALRRAEAWVDLARAILEQGIERNMDASLSNDEREAGLADAAREAEAWLKRAALNTHADFDAEVARAFLFCARANGAALENQVASIESTFGVRPGSEILPMLLGAGKPDKDAEALFSRAIDLAPSNYIAYVNRGSVRGAAGDLTGALADLDEALRIYPKYVGALINRGSLKSQAGDPAGALADLGAALKLDPESVVAYFNRANVLRDLKEYDRAFADYEAALRRRPRFVNALFNRGGMHFRMDRFEDAERDFTAAIALDGSDAKLFHNRAVARESLDNLDGALADYAEALRLNPDLFGSYERRALVRIKTRDLAGAEADFTDFIRLRPDDPWGYFNRAMARKELKDYERAARDFEKVLDLRPDDPRADQIRGWIAALRRHSDF